VWTSALPSEKDQRRKIVAIVAHATDWQRYRVDATGMNERLLVTSPPGWSAKELLDKLLLDTDRKRGCLFSSDGTSGYELWRTDGTETGTTMVSDILTGSASSDAYPLAIFGNALYFAADDGIHGIELWRTDGSAAGTAMVKDIAPGGATSSSAPSDAMSLNGALFFTADDGSTGMTLWKSDGTAAGTVQVKDFSTGVFPEFCGLTGVSCP
jgi:ELWxxDGT repeat protein